MFRSFFALLLLATSALAIPAGPQLKLLFTSIFIVDLEGLVKIPIASGTRVSAAFTACV